MQRLSPHSCSPFLFVGKMAVGVGGGVTKCLKRLIATNLNFIAFFSCFCAHESFNVILVFNFYKYKKKYSLDIVGKTRV